MCGAAAHEAADDEPLRAALASVRSTRRTPLLQQGVEEKAKACRAVVRGLFSRHAVHRPCGRAQWCCGCLGLHANAGCSPFADCLHFLTVSRA